MTNLRGRVTRLETRCAAQADDDAGPSLETVLMRAIEHEKRHQTGDCEADCPVCARNAHDSGRCGPDCSDCALLAEDTQLELQSGCDLRTRLARAFRRVSQRRMA